MASLLSVLFLGLTVGLLARAVKPGEDSQGWITTSLLGIAGAFLATYFGTAFGWFSYDEPAGWAAAAVGALVFVLAYGVVARRW